MDYLSVSYKLYALPIPINAASFTNIFNALTCSILILLGLLSSFVIYLNKEFVFAPVIWTISVFLQQGTQFEITPEKNPKATKLRVFLTYCVISIWLFNAFTVAGMFSGEFFSLFTTNMVPDLPRSLEELLAAQEVQILSTSTIYLTDNFTASCLIKEVTIPRMLNTSGYSQSFLNILLGIKKRVKWIRDSAFNLAHNISLNLPVTIYKSGEIERPKVFAMIGYSPLLHDFETSMGIFKKYFIKPLGDGILEIINIPWLTYRNHFGGILKDNLGYLVQSGVYDYWNVNYRMWYYLNDLKVYHDFQASIGNPQGYYTNYFLKVVLANTESNVANLAKEGEAFGMGKIKMLFLIYFGCVVIATSAYLVEGYKIIKYKKCIHYRSRRRPYHRRRRHYFRSQAAARRGVKPKS